MSLIVTLLGTFFFSSRRRHTRYWRDWSSDVCSSDLLAGMLWSKQFYHYIVEQWLRGDPAQPPPPPERKYGRNREWRHLYNERVMSMPDKWEYPWYASWRSEERRVGKECSSRWRPDHR